MGIQLLDRFGLGRKGELSDQRMEDWVVDTKCKQTKILVVQAKSSLLMVEAVEQPSQSQ